MRVRVRLFASLRDRLPGAKRGEGWLEIHDGATLLELLERLEIPDPQAQMVLVNGDQAPRGVAERGELRLAENDTVSIFPPLAGG